jgi:anaerobic magnesium-protoporphyrin IX monomethyl ester cyclase
MNAFKQLPHTHNVLCIFPWAQGVSVTNWLPPLGLEYISAAIESVGIHTHLVDMRFEVDPVPLTSFPTDVICISVNWEDQLPLLPRLLENVTSDQTIIVGGRAASFHTLEVFNQCPQVSIVVRGDGEETIREIFAGKSINTITGLSYRHNGMICHNPNRHFDTIPEEIFPDRNKRNNPYHIRMGNFDTGIALDVLSSSRGCPFHCKFCTFSKNPLGEKRPWSGRSPHSVVRELETLEADYVLFTDDHFSADAKRVEQICDLIIQKNIKKTLAVALRIEVAFHEKLLEKLFKAGFRFLSLGIESTNDRTLLELEKGFDTNKVREACRRLRKYPFLLIGYFIVGNIGEDEADMLKIADFAHELGLDFIYPSYLKIEKYSPLEELISTSPDYYVNPKGYICSKNYPRDSLKLIRQSIHRQFYTVPQLLSIARKVFQYHLISWRNFVTISLCGLQHTSARKKKIKQQKCSREGT